MVVADESANAPLRDNPNIDLFCLTCGYNLRGLTGDPRRCPECGANNELCELELPAGKIAAQLKKMENSLSAAAALFGISGALLALGLMLVDESISLCPLSLSGASAFFGLLSLQHFRLSCGDHPGAPAAGWRYISIALGGMAIIVLPMAALSLWIQENDRTDGFGFLIIFAMVAGVLTTIAILIARPLHRRLQATIQPMQRARAVEIVREYQRNRLLRK